MEGKGNAIRIRVSEGAIRNDYLTLRGHLDFFPPDTVGGNTDADAGRVVELEVEGLPDPVSTDVNGPKQRFRVRSAWRRFFADQAVQQGDVVEIRRLDPYRYAIRVAERRGGLDVRGGLTSRGAVLQAIAEFDELGRETFLEKYGFGLAKSWHLIHHGSRYDSKAIYGVAFGYEHPDIGPLHTDDFSGGESTVVRRLQELGFELQRSLGDDLGPDQARVWLIRAGRGGRYENTALEHNVVLIGWAAISDVGTATREELKERIKRETGEKRPASLASQAGQIYRFVHEVEIGDLAVLPLLSDPNYVAIGRVVGDYEYRDEDGFQPDARNTRAVVWLGRRVPYERFDPDLREAFGQQGTVSEITKDDAERRLLSAVSGSDASAIHLVLKWSAEKESNTIELHREVAESDARAVWWGRVATKPDATGLADEWIVRLREQLRRGSETFVFLHGKASTWRTRLLDITLDEADVDQALVPDYYDPADHHSLWVKITDFEQVEPVELTRDFVLAKSGDPVTAGGLGNQGPLIVRKLSSGVTSGYFILNQKAGGSEYDDVEGERYSWTERSSGAWKQLADLGDARFIYYRPGTASDGTGKSYFGVGRITDIEELEAGGGVRRFTARLSDYRRFNAPVPFADGPSRNAQTSIQPITQAQYEDLLRQGLTDQGEISEFDVPLVRQFTKVRGLQLADDVLHQVVSALASGKHVILTGPPGTAKTTLAQCIAEAAEQAGQSKGYVLTTATADWTTFETIGGLKPTAKNTLVFEEGHFLSAIERGEWLVIDELNRSNFDRAFGQFFTVLSGQPVVLPYSREGDDRPLVLVPEGAASPVEPADTLPIPHSWRIVATMNVFDKTLLFEMSFALMRRFAFIEVASPSEEVFEALIEMETSGDKVASTAAKQLLAVRALKDLGPAVFMDIARYMSARRSSAPGVDEGLLIFEAFYSFLLPQFEGIDARQGEDLFERIAEHLGSAPLRERLRQTLNVVLGLDLAFATSELEDEDLADFED